MASAKPVPTRSPEQNKLQRQQAKKLLAVERKTLVTARSDVHAIVGETNLEIARGHDRKHAELLLLLLLASKRMRSRLKKRIEAGRMQARLAGIGRIRAELALAGVGLAIAHALVPRRETDASHAEAGAASFASAWSSAALYFVSAAERDGTSIVRAIDKATETTESRMQTVVATNAAHAYNDEHRDDVSDLAESYPDVMFRLERRWSAFLDACPRCAAMDGERAPLCQAFAGGLEPGYMHLRCRCLDELVPVESP